MKPIIIGGGLAGLTAALSLAPLPVTLITPRKLGTECSSAWAQGGIAAALGMDDSAELHAGDTLKAGAGLCQPAIVKQVTGNAAAIIDQLIKRGVAFDRDAAGALLLGLEAAHSRRRIVHAQGANTGAVIMQALVTAARATPSIEILEETSVTAIHAPDGGVQAVTVQHNGKSVTRPASCVVLATGGAGALWQDTTNPLGSWGSGLALAAKAGAELGDLEFMQFHPTAIAIGRDPMPLASEALRGEGCTLIDETGERFIDELERRDIVARAIAAHYDSGHQVYLDARQALGASFSKRYPAIAALCKQGGIDPATMPIPIRPAAHYHMGGVITDDKGRSSVMGLWACGEVACTGLHGANRLASNSLLEAAVFGARVAADIADFGTLPTPVKYVFKMPAAAPAAEPVTAMRAAMSRWLGGMREAEGLTAAVNYFLPLATTSDRAAVSLLMALAALRRHESRGAHTRSDYPQTDEHGGRVRVTLAQALQAAQHLTNDRRQAIGA